MSFGQPHDASNLANREGGSSAIVAGTSAEKARFGAIPQSFAAPFLVGRLDGNPQSQARSWIGKIPMLSGGFVAVAGLGALLGWAFDIPVLRAGFPGVAAIPPLAALLFLSAGLSLLFRALRSTSRLGARFGLACAIGAAAVGALYFADYCLATPHGTPGPVVVRLNTLFHAPATEPTSIWAVLVYGALGLAPLLLDTRRFQWPAEFLIVGPLAVTFLSLVSEAFRVIGAPPSQRPSALANVLLLLVLELGLLLARPGRGAMAVLTADGVGGSLARRLLPVAVFVPFGAGWLGAVAQRAGVIPREVGGALFALAIVFLQSIVVLVYAVAADRTDRRRKEAEAFVRCLFRAGANLNSTLDADALLAILAKEAVQITGASGGLAGLRSGNTMISVNYVLDGNPLPLDAAWTIGVGLAGRVAKSRQPYRTNDAGSDACVDGALRTRFCVESALAVPVLDSFGEAIGFCEVHNKVGGGFTDEDERRLAALAPAAATAIQNALAYRNLREAEQALKEADRQKNVFLATLAHELRNPLAPIRNGLEVMRLSERPGPGGDEILAMIGRQVGHMVRLVDDLLDVSRISRGKVAMRRTPVAIATAVREAVEISRPAIDQAGHHLAVVLPDEPIFVDGDLTRLTQAFANLLNNAAKFTNPGGRIVVTAERDASGVAISFRDSGTGIAAEMLPRVFDVFAQAEQSLDRPQAGLGIGLSLVRGLIELHGGRIAAKSDGLGQGSEFVVWLPILNGSQQCLLDSASSESDFPGPRRRILVVDDNRDAATSLGMILQLMGNEIRTAEDGLAAVDAAHEFRPDTILLDIGLPKLNGYDACRRIREQPWSSDILIVALTGWGQAEDRRRSQAAGFDHHLVKPVDMADLSRILAQPTPPARP